MMLLSTLFVLLLLRPLFLVVAQNVQFPLKARVGQETLRVAIIGAGAAGSSTAYHLSRFLAETDPSRSVNITIFDSNSHAGGRSTTVYALDSPAHPVELGASIFVRINHILYNASKEFGLVTNKAFHNRPKISDFSLGVWDGQDFAFKQASDDDDENSRNGWVDWKAWWDIAKLLWRYGLAPIRTQRATKESTGRFLRFYEAPIFPFRSLTKAVERVGLLEYTSVTGSETLMSAGVSEAFQRDIIQASTRVNYAQNLDQIHGLEALVCMATEGAMSIEGGNWQIFSKMVEDSKSHIRMNTTVISVDKGKDGTYTISSAEKDSLITTSNTFDTLILAAPHQSTNITFAPPLTHTPEPIPYVSLHVTLFTTPHLLSPRFFNQASQSDVPAMILTTLPSTPPPLDSLPVGPAGLWSISILRTLPTAPPQYLYKIFSPTRITGTLLVSLLNIPNHTNTSSYDPISTLPKSDLSWSYEKVWSSYPYETPRTQFEEIRLDCPSLSQCTGGKGVWYTSGIESFISTMETSALMGKNIARLIVDDMLGAEKVAS